MRAMMIVVGALLTALCCAHFGAAGADTCADSCDRAYASCSKSCKQSDTNCFTKCINEKESCLAVCK